MLFNLSGAYQLTMGPWIDERALELGLILYFI